MPTEEYKAIYHPSIHFKNEDWLAYSALYWDKMARIVPGDRWSKRDSEFVMRLQHELGYVEDAYPHDFVESAAPAFLRFISDNEEALKRKYRLDKPKQPQAEVFSSKMDYSLMRELVSKGLALEGDHHVLMPKKLAEVYIACLASTIGRSEYLPVTDNPLNHYAVANKSVDRKAEVLLPGEAFVNPPITRTTYANISITALKVLAPKHPEELTIEKIKTIRTDLKDERLEFRKSVEEFVTEHIACLRDGDTQVLEQIFNDRLKRQLDTINDAYRRSFTETVKLTLFVSPWTLVTNIFPALHIPTDSTALCIGAVASSAAVVLQQARTELKKQIGPATYVMRVQNVVTPPTRLKALKSSARRFFAGV